MRPPESVEQYMNRRFYIIDVGETVDTARKFLESGYEILIVAQNQQPTFVLEMSDLAGTKGSQLIKNITSELDEVITVTSKTDLRDVKEELKNKTAIVVCDDDRKNVMGTLSVYDLVK